MTVGGRALWYGRLKAILKRWPLASAPDSADSGQVMACWHSWNRSEWSDHGACKCARAHFRGPLAASVAIPDVLRPALCAEPKELPLSGNTTSTGMAFVEPKTTQSVGCGGPFYELNLSTLQVTAVNNIGSFCIQPEGFPMAASGDGSKVGLATTDISGLQGIAIYDVASNTWSTNSVLENFGGNAAISENGTVFATGSGLLDSKANLLGYLAWQDVFQSPGPYPSLGLEKIPDGGSLVYIPYGSITNLNVTYPGFIDIFDVNHGALLRRINLTEQIQPVTDAMTIDAYGQNIFLITNAGLTAVKMDIAPLAIGSVTPTSVSVGTNITISGSGFQSGAVVTANGVSASTSFVDANTLQVLVPSLAAGPVQLIVTKPSGETYSLDNAFTVQ